MKMCSLRLCAEFSVLVAGFWENRCHIELNDTLGLSQFRKCICTLTSLVLSLFGPRAKTQDIKPYNVIITFDIKRHSHWFLRIINFKCCHLMLTKTISYFLVYRARKSDWNMKRLLLRCIHHFKIWTIYAFRVLNPHQWS